MERNMIITRHKPDIVQYDNFLTPDECKSIIDVLAIKMEKEQLKWMPISFYESYSSGTPELNDPDTIASGLPGDFFVDLRQRVIDATADMAGKDPEQMSQISWHSQRWAPGAFANMHSDNTSNDGVSGAFTRSRYATFLYLNDDFEDGVLNFKHGLTIAPKTGTLVTFAGGFHNMHEVTTVKNLLDTPLDHSGTTEKKVIIRKKLEMLGQKSLLKLEQCKQMKLLSGKTTEIKD